MALGTTLRELVLKISADPSGALKELDKLEGKVDKTKSKLEGLGSIAEGLFGGVVLDRMRAFVEGGLEFGTMLSDTSAQLGITTQELQGLGYAFNLTGVSTEKGTAALTLFSRTLEEAGSGSAEGAKRFAALGVNVKDAQGNLRPTVDVLRDVADGIAKLPEGAQRAGVASQFFGKAGAKLVPLLSQGAAGIAELTEEAEKLGVILAKEDVDAIAKADDAFDSLHQTTRSLQAFIAARFAPTFQRFANTMRDTVVPNVKKLLKETRTLQIGVGVFGVASAVAMGKAAFGIAKTLGLVKDLNSLLSSLGKGTLLFGLVLVLEDIYTWLDGGDSLIGEFLEKALGAEEANTLLREMQEVFGGIWDTLKELGPILLNAFKAVLPVLGAVVRFVLLLAGALIDAVVQLGKLAAFDWGILKKVFGGGSVSKEDSAKAGELLGGFSRAGNIAKGAFGIDVATPGARAGAADLGPKQVQQTNSIIINGASDPTKTANAIGGAMADQRAALSAMG